MDDISDIAAMYDSDAEKEHTRLERHQLEADMTWRYFDQYLPPHASILEIGAATGRYTLELARRGHALTALDLSAVELEKCRQRLAEAGLENRVRLAVADARDLNHITPRNFDAVLLMGPLYHLVMEDDRKTALRQAYDHLREGGLIFSACISRLGIMGDLIKNVPGWIEDPEADAFLQIGMRPEELPRGGFRGYFARPEEVAPLHEAAGFTTLALAGVEPGISSDDESYNQLEGSLRKKWLDLLFAISAEPSTLGASRHLLYIGKK